MLPVLSTVFVLSCHVPPYYIICQANITKNIFSHYVDFSVVQNNLYIIYRKDLYTSYLGINMCLTVILCGVDVAYAWLEWRPDNARRFKVVQAS